MKRRRNVNAILAVWTVVFGVIALTSLCCSVIMYIYFTREDESVTAMAEQTVSAETDGYSESEVDSLIDETVSQAVEKARDEATSDFLTTMRDMMEEEGSTVNMLRYFYPDNVIVYSGGKYNFLPILSNVAKNTYQDEFFIQDEEGIASYDDGNGLISHKGIDVSRFQGEIDWEKVKNDGVEFALIRLGVRGYTEGAIVLDQTYEANMEGALSQGIHTGVYFFTQATTEEEVKEEVDFTLENLKDYQIDGPIVIDVEDVNNGKGRTGALTAEERTKLIKAFCDQVKEAGYTPMIYGNLKSMTMMVDLTQLEEYEKWYAFYGFPVYYPYAYSILQYSESGKVDGISTEVDLNIAFDTWW
ncbi:MAG: glycoside hydrolase family 25 protein [Lachnospiraceae bacterium]|nr:glycoside hydrolase family 25 protein [Lachnospiraceae bacterium]